MSLNKKEDIAYVKKLLEEFVEKTGSLVAEVLLNTWPEPTTRIVKVFPFEYQRALKQLAEDKVAKPVTAVSNGNGSVKDIEDSIEDADMAQKKLDKVR